MGDLVSVHDQREVVFRDAPPAFLEELKALAARHGTKVLSIDKPRTTLEQLFLEVTEHHE
jgi:hypothetical protein